MKTSRTSPHNRQTPKQPAHPRLMSLPYHPATRKQAPHLEQKPKATNISSQYIQK
jgi:hypothetical protein